MRPFEQFANYPPDPRASRSGVTIPRIWVTVALSVLIHLLVLWQLPQKLLRPSSETEERSEPRGPLSVQLSPRASPRPAPPRPPSPPQRPRVAEAPRLAKRTPQPRPAARPQPRAPVIALDKPVPRAPPAPRPAQRPVPAIPRAPAGADFAADVEARRRARAEAERPPAAPSPFSTAPESVASAPPAEDANARANRLAAANLGTNKTPTFGSDTHRGGGVFTIKHMGYDYAEFIFFGWNKDIRRNTQQVIEVRKGNNSDIRLAVVRKMIAIIREYEKGDFIWESPRLGRNLTLSARARDNAGLEQFMMTEFFEDDRRP